MLLEFHADANGLHALVGNNLVCDPQPFRPQPLAVESRPPSIVIEYDGEPIYRFMAFKGREGYVVAPELVKGCDHGPDWPTITTAAPVFTSIVIEVPDDVHVVAER